VVRQVPLQALAVLGTNATLRYFLLVGLAVAVTAATHLAEMEVAVASVPVEEAVVLVVPQVEVALVEMVAQA
jgi:hypothetical protein